MLVDHADSAVERVVRVLQLHFLTIDEYLSFIGLIKTHDHVHQSGLSGSVLSHKRKNLMLTDCQ